MKCASPSIIRIRSPPLARQSVSPSFVALRNGEGNGNVKRALASAGALQTPLSRGVPGGAVRCFLLPPARRCGIPGVVVSHRGKGQTNGGKNYHARKGRSRAQRAFLWPRQHRPRRERGVICRNGEEVSSSTPRENGKENFLLYKSATLAKLSGGKNDEENPTFTAGCNEHRGDGHAGGSRR